MNSNDLEGPRVPEFQRDWIETVARRFHIDSRNIVGGEGHVRLRVAHRIMKAYVRDAFQIGDSESARGVIEFHVYGSSSHDEYHLKKSPTGRPGFTQNGDVVEFTGTIVSIIGVSTSIAIFGGGPSLRTSFTALVDVGEGEEVVLNTVGSGIHDVHLGDTIEGRAVPVFSHVPD